MRYLLIPSCEVATKDNLEGTTTERRLVRGLALWQSGGYDAIIVTGGIYQTEDSQTIPSGELMRRWLVERGVARHQIICEKTSRDTYENISQAMALIDNDHDPNITVVTHWQHALRFWITFRRAHEQKVRIAPMWYWIGIKAFVLEWGMLLIHLFDKKGTGRVAAKNKAARTQPKR